LCVYVIKTKDLNFEAFGAFIHLRRGKLDEGMQTTCGLEEVGLREGRGGL